MYKGTPYVNKIVKKRQEDRIKFYHRNNLRNVRPITSGLDILQSPAAVINHKKKQMLQEDRFTQIQRQNRMLLEKIQIIMSKKNTKQISQQKARMNKSLNHGFRKKQLEGIQVENAKLLKRLQQKKSSYEAQKLKQQWKKQKHIIKNLANYPFIIRDRPQKRKSLTSHSLYKDLPSNNLQSSIQLMRIRQIDGQSFLVTVRLDEQKLNILADNKATKQIKIIDLSRQEAIQFIQFQCDGRIQKIYERLKYDSIKGILYLVGKNAKIDYQNPQQVERKMQNINEETQNQLEESILETKRKNQQSIASIQKYQSLNANITETIKQLQNNEFIQNQQHKHQNRFDQNQQINKSKQQVQKK